MCELGNTVINQIYEGACEEQGLKKPGPNSSRSVCGQISAIALYKLPESITWITIFFLLMTIYFHMLNVSLIEAPVSASDVSFRQEKEAWIKAKYVERKFLKKMCGSEALVEGSRKPHHWSVKKCRRHNSSIRAPKTRRKYRHDAGIVSPANLSAGNCLVISEHLFYSPE